MNKKCYSIHRQSDGAMLQMFATEKGAMAWAERLSSPWFIVEDYR